MILPVFAGCSVWELLDAVNGTDPTVGELNITQGTETSTEPPESEPPVTEPPVTEPPVTEPPVTEPPVTEPPVTEPPVTEPPVTEPPVTEPPAPQPDPKFMVGYGRVDITPTQTIYLAGYGNEDPPRYSTEIWNRLYATCIAYTDTEGNSMLMFHLDILNAYDEIVGLRPVISAATGVPKNNIVIAATHNHSGPSYVQAAPDGYLAEYKVAMKQWLIDAAVEAMADRKPAEMYIASCNPTNMVFVRHYVYKNGSINGYGGSSTAIGHAEPADNQMQLIKFVREGGKDVLLMNWQGHPRGHTEDHYAILSDVDVIRQKLEKDMNCLFAYFLGASGNQNNSSPIVKEQRTKNYQDHGITLATEAMFAAKNFVKVETGKVQTLSQRITVTRKSTDNNFATFIETRVFAIGDVAFVIAGYEMFAANGMDIKEASPFKMTFVVTCANGDNKYIPSKASFAYDSYEGNATRYVAGTAEILATNYISLLKQINKAR